MRSEVGEWLPTCVGSPICILLLSWSLLIYQNQPSSSKRRIDILTVAILSESLAHQLGLLLYAILTLIRPANHFGELCSTLVWMLNSSSILQELTLTSIAIFAAISREENLNLTKNHLKYHLVCLSVVSACIGVTGVLNFEPEVCVFLPQEISTKYGIFVNSLRILLVLTSLLSLFVTLFKNACRPVKSELLKSVSDLSEASSKNSSGAYECHPQHWDPSSGSCTSGSTNSRTCLRKKKVQVDEASGRSTVFSILFVCYVFDILPTLMEFQQEELNKLLTDWVVQKYLPFSFFDDKHAQNVFDYLRSDAKVPKRTQMKNLIFGGFEEMQKIILEILQKNISKVSFTLDGWSSINDKSFYGIIGCFLFTEI